MRYKPCLPADRLKTKIMNTKKIRVIVYCAIIAFTIIGCNKSIDVTTKVYPDGSCDRIMTIEGDTGKISSKDFPFSIDHNWDTILTFKQKINEKNDTSYRHELIASKHFESIEELNKAIQNDQSEYKHLYRSVNLERKFRWFYTFLSYHEKYDKLIQFDKIPITDYLTDMEIDIYRFVNADKVDSLANEESIRFLFREHDEILESEMELVLIVLEANKDTVQLSPEDSIKLGKIDLIASKKYDKIENKFDEWFARNAFEEFFDIFHKGVISILPHKDIYDTIIFQKDTLFELFSICEIEYSDSVFEVFSNYFTDEIWEVKEKKAAQFEDYDNRITAWITAWNGNYNNRLLMPGKVIESDMENVKGDTLIWEVGAGKMILDEFNMTATSKLTNNWAFIISLVIIVIALISILYKRKSRKI